MALSAGCDDYDRPLLTEPGRSEQHSTAQQDARLKI
jgi:hypothetical protein